MKTAIIIGRFQPITKAHYEIIDNAIKKYPQTFVVIINSKPSIVANTRRRLRATDHDLPQQDDAKFFKKVKERGHIKDTTPSSMKKEIEKNPFSGALRAKMIYDAFGGKLHRSRIIQAPIASIDKIVNQINDLTGFKDFVIISGSERQPYKEMIKVAKEKKYVADDINMEIEFISRDLDSADNISATKVRQAIRNGDKEEFLKLVPAGIENYFDKLKKYLMTESQRSFFRRMLLEMTHIEDLKVSDFISFVKDIYKAEASIKLDGTTNIAFGLSEDGRLYTALGKNAFHKDEKTDASKRFYSSDEWLKQGKIYYNAHASVHAALEAIDLKVLNPGEEVMAEVMFGDKPNCIKYDFGGVNHLVILNNKQVADSLNKQVVHITVNNLVIDVDELKEQTVKQTWAFGKTQVVDPKKYNINIEQELKELEAFLEAETDGFRNMDILGMKALGKKSEMVKQVRDKAQSLKLNIKEQLLKQFVRQVREGEYIPSQGYSHEGIVLKKDGEMTKIIDKNVFTSIHERDWKPAHDADGMMRNLRKNGITKQEALDYLNDRINKFDDYYPDVAKDIKGKMLDTLKTLKMEIKNEYNA